MEIDKQRIEDAIIKQVATDMIGDDDIWNRAKNALDERFDKVWRETAEARIRSEVELAISEGFEREYTKADSFGRQQGEKTTIRAELERLIGGYWKARVGSDGKPKESGYNTTTRAEWMMTQLVADDFTGAMKQHVIDIGGSLKDALRAELHATVNRLLSETFKVRSLDDQGKNRKDSSVISPPEKVRP